MNKRSVLLPLALLAAAALVLIDDSSVAPIVDFLAIAAGVLLMLRGMMLRGGRAQPSGWGHTFVGTFFTGLGLALFGLEGRLTSLSSQAWIAIVMAGCLALAVGAVTEGRAASRYKAVTP